MADKVQTLMTQAYDRWQNMPWSKQDFWDQLDADERIAVFVGNMNYQVENGGFMQWYDNGYATDEVIGFLKRLTQKIATPAAHRVFKLLERFEQIGMHYFKDPIFEEGELDDEYGQLDRLDREYYEINEQWLNDVEEYLKQ